MKKITFIIILIIPLILLFPQNSFSRTLLNVVEEVEEPSTNKLVHHFPDTIIKNKKPGELKIKLANIRNIREDYLGVLQEQLGNDPDALLLIDVMRYLFEQHLAQAVNLVVMEGKSAKYSYGTITYTENTQHVPSAEAGAGSGFRTLGEEIAANSANCYPGASSSIPISLEWCKEITFTTPYPGYYDDLCAEQDYCDKLKELTGGITVTLEPPQEKEDPLIPPIDLGNGWTLEYEMPATITISNGGS